MRSAHATDPRADFYVSSLFGSTSYRLGLEGNIKNAAQPNSSQLQGPVSNHKHQTVAVKTKEPQTH